MSFNVHARNALDPNRPIWRRWSSLHSCLELLRASCPPGTFPATHARWVKQWNIGPDNPPTDAQLFEAVHELTVARNKRAERMRAFERKRIREKMQGKRNVTKAERAGWERISRIDLNR